MKKTKMQHPADYYPGVSADIADDNKTDKKDVKQDIKLLNNNPRNTDMHMPQ